MIRSLLALVATLCVALAFGQDNTPPTVKLTLPKQAKPGAKVQAVVEITFAEGLHGYQNPPKEDYQIPVKVAFDCKGFVFAKPAYPKGVMRAIGGDPNPTPVYEGTLKIPVTVTVPKKPGATEIKVTVSYQQCNDSACFPPSTVTGAAKLIVKK